MSQFLPWILLALASVAMLVLAMYSAQLKRKLRSKEAELELEAIRQEEDRREAERQTVERRKPYILRDAVVLIGNTSTTLHHLACSQVLQRIFRSERKKATGFAAEFPEFLGTFCLHCNKEIEVTITQENKSSRLQWFDKQDQSDVLKIIALPRSDNERREESAPN